MKKRLPTEKLQEAALTTDGTMADEIINSLPGVFYIYDEDWRLVRWNKRQMEVTGYSAEELLHRHALEFIEGDDKLAIAAGMKHAFEKGVAAVEANLVTKDGRRIPHYFTGQAATLNGKTYLLGLGIDVSERKRAEEALRKSEARFKEMAELLPEAVYECSIDGKVTYTNRMALDALGHTREDFARGLCIWEVLVPADRERARDAMRELLATGRRKASEYTAVRKNGSTLPVMTYSSPIIQDGRVVGVRGIMVDITERVCTEKRLRWRADQVIRFHKCLLKLARLSCSDETAQIREITESDAQVLEAEQVSVWLFDSAGTSIICEDLYSLSKGTHEKAGTLKASGYPHYFEALKNSRAIAVVDACSDPRTSEFAETYLKPQGISSLMDAPVWLHGKVVGVVCHEHIGPMRAWSPEEQDFAASIADMVSLSLEATDRKRAEEALSRSEKDFRDLAENIPIGVYRSTPDGKMVMANATMVGMLGYQCFEDLAGRNLELECEVHQYTRSAYKEQIEREGRVIGLESIWKRDDGSTVCLRENARAVFDEEGRALYYEGTLEDITAQKWTEEALRQEAEFRRATIERAAEGLCVCHAIAEYPYVRFTVWNKRMTEITGYTMEEINAKGWYQSVYPDPEYRARAEERMARMRLGDDLVAEEWEITRADGAKRILCLSTSVLSTGGAEGQVLALMQDVTERKRAEAELRKYQEHLEELVRERTTELEGANAQLQDEIRERRQLETDLIKAREAAEGANRAKSVFLANMSHGIRTPMNAILGYAQILERDPAMGKLQREYVDVINRSGEHLLALINNILEMSKIEAGRVTCNPQEFDFHAMIDDIVAMFRVRADEKDLFLEVTRVGSVPRYLCADGGKIREVIINLLGNAVKFTDVGHIAVRVRSLACSGETAEHTLVIEVEDTGCGIATDEIDKAFELFEQTRSGRCQVGGTGLGLPISREYARMMGGDIVAESFLGSGSTFCFTFQARAVEKAGAGEGTDDKRTRVVALAPGRPAPRVLVVDDDEASRDALTLHLELVGFDVRKANDGKEALALFETWRPDVVLMDLWMPEMDGLEATRRIKATPAGLTTPVLTVTASVLEESEREARRAGSDGFIRKPFSKVEVFNELKRVLGIEYVYEQQECASGGTQTEASNREPALLPVSLLQRITEAAECGDGAELRKLLEENQAALGPELSEHLDGLANGYRYEEITDVLVKSGIFVS